MNSSNDFDFKAWSDAELQNLSELIYHEQERRLEKMSWLEVLVTGNKVSAIKRLRESLHTDPTRPPPSLRFCKDLIDHLSDRVYIDANGEFVVKPL